MQGMAQPHQDGFCLEMPWVLMRPAAHWQASRPTIKTKQIRPRRFAIIQGIHWAAQNPQPKAQATGGAGRKNSCYLTEMELFFKNGTVIKNIPGRPVKPKYTWAPGKPGFGHGVVGC